MSCRVLVTGSGGSEKIKFDIRLVVHNAGSVGDITKRSSELSDEQQWADYLQSNFISTVYLNNLIYSAIGKEVRRC